LRLLLAASGQSEHNRVGIATSRALGCLQGQQRAAHRMFLQPKRFCRTLLASLASFILREHRCQ
jgi:hypothetical protein